MTLDEIKAIVTEAVNVPKSEGLQRLKATVPNTYHWGNLSGNRLNSSTLRSQLIFCQSKKDWRECDDTVKRLFYDDQRIFVQTGDDEWDVFKGSGPLGGGLPTLVTHMTGLEEYLAEQTIATKADGGDYAPYLAAIRTKPFVLLAGISGTGKSRMVRQLARGCCPKARGGKPHPLYDEGKPGNFEMIQVRPNWHDSSELMGYVTRIVGAGEPPKYLVTAFVEFLAKAWVYREVPFFLCLDEMNLAPVEQYFAEYLSVVETRRRMAFGADEVIATDPIVRWENLEKETFENAVGELFNGKAWANDAQHGRVEEVRRRIAEDKGIRIPPNLVVMGTVNMDETTCSFSRKVLDRAMSFELNDVGGMYDPADLAGECDCAFGSIGAELAEPKMLTGKEAYGADPAAGGKVLGVLRMLNEEAVPAKGENGEDEEGATMTLLAKTPFKIAYRTRNEIMVYCVERMKDGTKLAHALDEALSMKVLSRIEGDNQHVPRKWLVTLSAAIDAALGGLDGYDAAVCKGCREKLAEMAEQADCGYTSFWTR